MGFFPHYKLFLLRHEMKIQSFEMYDNRIENGRIIVEINSFKLVCQLVSLTFCKLHCIKLFKIRGFGSPLRNSKSIRNVRKFVISEFVTTVKFFKNLLRILPGLHKLC